MTSHLVDKKNSEVIGRRPIKKIPMWRLRQANTQKWFWLPRRLKLVRGKPLIYMKGRLLQSLTITKIKLKPLPENPRI